MKWIQEPPYFDISNEPGAVHFLDKGTVKQEGPKYGHRYPKLRAFFEKLHRLSRKRDKLTD